MKKEISAEKEKTNVNKLLTYKLLTFKKFSWKEPILRDSGHGTDKDWANYDRALKKKPVLKTGDVLFMKDGKYLLVGDVNKNLGVCDDCTDYSMEDIKAIATLPGF